MFLILFGFSFFSIGAFLCWLGVISPVVKSFESRSWVKVPCTIRGSEVKSRHSSEGVTYKIAITYTYAVDGKLYQSNRYDFNDAASSGQKGKAKVVARYPVGMESVCWVNPDDPTEAVLSRKIPMLVYLMGPFCALFIFLGAGIMLAGSGLLASRASPRHSRHERLAGGSTGPAELEPSVGPIGKLLGTFVFALIWNGIVSIFVWQAMTVSFIGKPSRRPISHLQDEMERSCFPYP